MRRRWIALGIGVCLPLVLIVGGRLWTLRAASRPVAGSPFLVDPSLIVSRAQLAQRGLSGAPWVDGWQDLSPAPLGPGFLSWERPVVQKAQSVEPGGPAAPSIAGPTSKPTLSTPANNSSVAPGSSATFSWAPLPGAAFYFLEHTGQNLTFTNPNGTWPDVRNGHLGRGAGFLIPGGQTSFPVNVGANAPLGAYQWRVIAIGSDSNHLGIFSDAFTINIGTSQSAGPTLEGEGGNR